MRCPIIHTLRIQISFTPVCNPVSGRRGPGRGEPRKVHLIRACPKLPKIIPRNRCNTLVTSAEWIRMQLYVRQSIIPLARWFRSANCSIHRSSTKDLCGIDFFWRFFGESGNDIKIFLMIEARSLSLPQTIFQRRVRPSRSCRGSRSKRDTRTKFRFTYSARR